MSLLERSYSVLVVSAAEKLNTALLQRLPEFRCGPILVASNVSAAKRLCSERSFDFILVNSPLPDDTGVRYAIDMATAENTVVLLLIRSELYAEIRDKVTEHGVFTLAKPLNASVLSLSLDWISSARERLRKLQKKTVSFEEKMEEIQISIAAKKAEGEAETEAEIVEESAANIITE